MSLLGRFTPRKERPAPDPFWTFYTGEKSLLLSPLINPWFLGCSAPTPVAVPTELSHVKYCKNEKDFKFDSILHLN
jgi:hypothetical protein